ncbi:hypothetical protein [Cohnella hongkongensis]|uniref:Uncharacterized protein n=1 Tax=Cohnella hongkongensis TaxID=178337 RepID=A0ABV9FF24_9BACL
MNLLTPGVMAGLIGASSHVQSTQASMAIYSQEAAKRKPNMEMMGRAIGYVGNALAAAKSEIDKAAEELEAAREKAEAEAEAEEAKLREEAAEKLRDQQEHASAPVDGVTVEISEEGQLVFKNSHTSGAAAAPTEGKAAIAHEPKIYSSSGASRSASAGAEPAVSIRV